MWQQAAIVKECDSPACGLWREARRCHSWCQGRREHHHLSGIWSVCAISRRVACVVVWGHPAGTRPVSYAVRSSTASRPRNPVSISPSGCPQSPSRWPAVRARCCASCGCRLRRPAPGPGQGETHVNIQWRRTGRKTRHTVIQTKHRHGSQEQCILEQAMGEWMYGHRDEKEVYCDTQEEHIST